MSKMCKYCIYWMKDRTMFDVDIGYYTGWGKCTRYPEHISTQHDHYCGEFKERDGE